MEIGVCTEFCIPLENRHSSRNRQRKGLAVAEDSFDVFCLECNTQVQTRVIATGNGGFSSDAVNPVDEADAEYHGDVYYVALCPRCNAPFLLKESRYGVPGEFETVTSKTVLYPKTTNLDFEGLSGAMRKSYEQALRCYSGSLFEPCALMCRRCLEILTKSFGVEKGTLEAKLKTLVDQNIIEARLAQWAHGIRVVGNEAAHDTDAELSKQDARDALDFTEALLTYVFVLNTRFESFQSRRKQRGGNSPGPVA